MGQRAKKRSGSKRAVDLRTAVKSPEVANTAQRVGCTVQEVAAAVAGSGLAPHAMRQVVDKMGGQDAVTTLRLRLS